MSFHVEGSDSDCWKGGVLTLNDKLSLSLHKHHKHCDVDVDVYHNDAKLQLCLISNKNEQA